MPHFVVCRCPGNRIREVRSAAFLSLARLNVLDLSNNMIFHLDTDAFRGLRSLQILKLEANQLQTLPAAESFVQFLPLKMAALGLHDNRWRCDCHLKPIREWIAHNNVPLPVKPVCSAPARLQGIYLYTISFFLGSGQHIVQNWPMMLKRKC